MAEERVFLEEGGLQVTSARFITPEKTYALSGVTSIGRGRVDPSSKGPMIAIAIGLVFLIIADGASKILGVGIMALGVWMFTRLEATHIVNVTSASTETAAYFSKDSTLVTRVIAALNEAIVHRG